MELSRSNRKTNLPKCFSGHIKRRRCVAFHLCIPLRGLMYHPQKILSDNRKTGCSIDLPIIGHCRPTQRCFRDCYAKRGPQVYKNSIRKHQWLTTYLSGTNISRLIQECARKPAVRLSGSGDLLPAHIPNLIRLASACHGTRFWGMTRKLEIARAINKAQLPNLKILVTVDATSPKKTWDYLGMLCYGPRHPDDQVPKDRRILTVFPAHYAGIREIAQLYGTTCLGARPAGAVSPGEPAIFRQYPPPDRMSLVHKPAQNHVLDAIFCT